MALKTMGFFNNSAPYNISLKTKLICKTIFHWLMFDHMIMYFFKDGCRWKENLAGKFILAYKIKKIALFWLTLVLLMKVLTERLLSFQFRSIWESKSLKIGRLLYPWDFVCKRDPSRLSEIKKFSCKYYRQILYIPFRVFTYSSFG